MEEQRTKLSERLLDFGAVVIRIARRMRTDFVDFHIAKQLVGSATSAGANYQEACAAESRADFIHKLQISLKELNETLYWLQLITRISEANRLNKLSCTIEENRELCAILGRSIITAKTRPTKTKPSFR